MAEVAKRSPATEPVAETRRSAVPSLAPDASVGAGFEVTLAACLRALRIATSRGDPERPETVHRFRVGVRRLRSLLAAFRGVLPAEENRHLSARLASFAKRYGRAREWDVFRTVTLEPMVASLPDEPALLEIDACAREARNRAMPPDVNFLAELDAVGAALDAAHWLHYPRPEFADEWRRPLKDFAVDLLGTLHRRLRKRLKSVDLNDQASFHRLRISAKKMRYPIEMFRTLFDEDAVSAYLEQLIAVQDALGHLNDALVARDLVATLPLSSRAQGLVNGWIGREIEACRDRFPAAARGCRRVDPFW